MTPSNIDWSLYRSFLAVLHEGSLSGAARALGSTQPSMGRHIAQLELALGATLFTRAPDGLRPTATALALQGPAETMAAAVRLAARVASGGQEAERGTVRITASQIMGGEVLPELLARYRDQHPRLTLELVLSNKSEDLLQREADIAVRMLRPTQKALIAKKLGRVDVGLFAHQRYAKAHGLPRSLPEMAQHTLIGEDQETVAMRLGQQHGMAITREMFQFRCDNDLAQLAALRAGMGIGGCHLGIARRDSALLSVLPETLTFSMEMWLVTHGDLRSNPLVMGLFRYLTEHLSAYALSSLRMA
jgi:DNA-binding transcriptional LysR family regulator